MEDLHAPNAAHFAEKRKLAHNPTRSLVIDLHEQLPDRMPTQCRNEIARDKTWMRREMGPDGHEVVSTASDTAACMRGEGS